MQMQYPNVVSLSHYGSQSSLPPSLTYIPFHPASSSSSSSDTRNDVPSVNASSMTMNDSMPILTSDLTSQWILNAFNCANLVPSNGHPSSVCSGDITSLFQLPSHSLSSLTSASLNTKEVIILKSCSLYPPRANAPQPTKRERPLGCRTVFVGGLPENVTEETIEEVFRHMCGDIIAIRMSKKNFCHIRFEHEESVDKAIAISGYRIKIHDDDDALNTGRLHIDYAQARDDQYDWECKQRALQREMRHRERMEHDRVCPPSPPHVHFNDLEAGQLIDKLKGEQTFHNAIHVLITWLERGECQKRNSGQFYGMIQTTNSHIRRLQTEKINYEQQWQNERKLYHSRMQNILVQLSQIEKVFEAAVRQKVWDHFTKAQRKHIDTWYKHTKELKNAQVKDVVNEREEDEMDLSDGDSDDRNMCNNINWNSYDKITRIDNTSNDTSNNEMTLRDENDTLKCQIESFRNDSVIERAENRQEKEVLEKQINILQQALQGMQHQLLTLSQQKDKDELEIANLRNHLKKRKFESDSQNTILSDDSEYESSHKRHSFTKNDHNDHNESLHDISKDALLIGLISIYFSVHPYGVTSDDISSYLKQQTHISDTKLLTHDFIESLLIRYPQLFSQFECNADENRINRIWRFCGFQQ